MLSIWPHIKVLNIGPWASKIHNGTAQNEVGNVVWIFLLEKMHLDGSLSIVSLS